MNITLRYFGKLREAAGVATEAVEAPDEVPVQDFIRDLATHRGETFEAILLTEEGRLRSAVMVLVNDAAVSKDVPHPLRDGDQVKLLVVIPGG